MTVRDIAYVELFTLDKAAVVDRLVTDLGFARVADSVQADRSSMLLRHGAVQVVVTSGCGTRKFVSDHGDGVADIALSCTDVEATAEAARRAGARAWTNCQGGRTVSAFGSIRHTLVPATLRQGRPGRPPGRQWIDTPGAAVAAAVADPPAEPDGRGLRLDHLGIRLTAPALTAYAAFCEDVLGFSRVPAEPAGPVVLRTGPGGPSLVLTAPDQRNAHHDGEPDDLDDFLDRNGGPGVHRLGFRTDGVASLTQALRLAGRRDHGSVADRLAAV